MSRHALLFAWDDDNHDQRENGEEQTKYSPSQRIAPLRQSNETADDRGDHATDGDENSFDPAENEPRRNWIRSRQNHSMQHVKPFLCDIQDRNTLARAQLIRSGLVNGVGLCCRTVVSEPLNTTPSRLTGPLESWGYWQGLRDADVA
jgi:hypothetical protein